MSWPEDEMLEGYQDGRKQDSPEPSGNRSKSYCHGFRNGRDDLTRNPRALAAVLRQQAEEAIKIDLEGV